MEQQISPERDWPERGLALLREMLPLMVPVAQSGVWTDEELDTLGLLLSATARSSESVLLLAAYGQLWDAEMVLRSVFEGTLKFAYLLATREAFKSRHDEYSRQLFELALLKDHQKAKDFLERVDAPEAREWRPIRERLLADPEREAFQKRYDRKVRAELEQRWGFTGLLKELQRSAEPALQALASLAWGYSLMSHVQHADYVGVVLPLEREHRSTARRGALHQAHLARLIVDAATCMLVRLRVGYRFISHDLAPVVVAASRVKALRESFGGAYERWTDVEYGTE